MGEHMQEAVWMVAGQLFGEARGGATLAGRKAMLQQGEAESCSWLLQLPIIAALAAQLSQAGPQLLHRPLYLGGAIPIALWCHNAPSCGAD